MTLDAKALDETLSAATQELLAARCAGGYWIGELSGSALATATAVCALALVDPNVHHVQIARGAEWLEANANDGGGWGDSPDSDSNVATTLLAWSALAAARDDGGTRTAAPAGCEAWLAGAAGGLDAPCLARAVAARYGQDQTFAAPILAMCALAGRLGPPEQAWPLVPALPFELAAAPRRLLKWLRAPVVSYALPALVAVGQVRHHFLRPRNPAARFIRDRLRRRTLALLESIQPGSGGFLEATPLTSFVVMSLAAMGLRDHPVVRRGVRFILASMRHDGSWPIDTNLATWVTTLSVNALASVGRPGGPLDRSEQEPISNWLLAQQLRWRHTYTDAAAGGWAWTDLPGGVPDADDTAGAMLALRRLAASDSRPPAAAAAGAAWLVGLQNRDGGIPTFCRGWGRLPFDRSSPDLTAHALAAWSAWRAELPPRTGRYVLKAMDRAAAYLARAQRPDGAWVPLWFGNQRAAGQANPTYGTARVVAALSALADGPAGHLAGMLSGGAGWLLAAQNDDGGWGGEPAAPSSIEETALAVEALVGAGPACGPDRPDALARGAAWLVEHTDRGRSFPAAPIGLYFAKLWYSERLYPLIFTVSALGRLRAAVRS